MKPILQAVSCFKQHFALMTLIRLNSEYLSYNVQKFDIVRALSLHGSVLHLLESECQLCHGASPLAV